MAQPVKSITHKRRQETFKVDDRVMLRHEAVGASFPHDKMAPLYVGPFRIVKVVSPSYFEEPKILSYETRNKSVHQSGFPFAVCGIYMSR